MKSSLSIKVPVLRVRVLNPYASLCEIIEHAVERGMNRCDKYSEQQSLTDGQRGLLLKEIGQSFWIALEDAGMEVK